MITATNEDNMVMMKRYPDNFFDLAIVDPPYGIGIDGQKKSVCKNANHNRKHHKKKNWDNEIPTPEYFNELKRVSKNQIIWGANYFVEYLKEGTKGWIFWYKGQQGLTMSDGEIAYSSFNKVTRMININRGFISENGLLVKVSIHPTQKPVKLYEWTLLNYAKKGDKILDTHRGSASLDIACHNLGFDLWTCEIDKEYFDDGNKRLKQHQQQLTMF
ncbi:MAG: site-specific DNA-methyltransferase [Proteobacteria bacterium]|nr:site-specific DNA-methyltransferase [Pseudomonadota bacterium]